MNEDFYLAEDLLSYRQALEEPVEADLADEALTEMLEQRTRLWQRGYWRIWEPDIARAIEVSKRLGSDEKTALFLAYRAGIHEALGQFKVAVELARQAEKFAQSPASRAAALFQLGAALHNLGKAGKASAALEEALRLAEDKEQKLAIRHKLMRACKALGRADRTWSLLRECMEEAAISNPWLHAELLLDEAGLLLEERPDLAERNVRLAQAHYETGFLRGRAYSHLELGRIALRLKKEEEALDSLARARALLDEEGYSPGLTQVFIEFGKVELSRRRYAEAAVHFARGFQLAQSSNYYNGMLRALLLEWKADCAGQGFLRATFSFAKIRRALPLTPVAVTLLWGRLGSRLAWW
jgi:tetratricopeptide (TPR) repeat protein